MIAKGKLGAGDLLWSEDRNTMRFTVVLEPEVKRQRCGEMVHLLMVAFGDAAGSISAPEIAINYRWPSEILVNEASVGSVDVILSDEHSDEIPNWMILGISIAIAPNTAIQDPGIDADRTTMWDEGCGDISRTELLESVSRHLVNWIHTWSEDGFRPVHEQWMGRISEKNKLSPVLASGVFQGLDAHGNALVKTDSGTKILETLDALETIRNATVPKS